MSAAEMGDKSSAGVTFPTVIAAARDRTSSAVNRWLICANQTDRLVADP
jgi:hypothetical protein